ncbi:MAG: SOS response-associated peptidase [Armatimonadota bacterium]|nr:SOS response-associated peptidase [Armatimonadota bacterium]
MCGRYTLHHSTEEVAERFAVQQIVLPLTARYNIAPSQPVAVVAQGKPETQKNGEDVRWLDAMKWGLVPFWAKDPDIGNRLINARAETLAEKPAFKAALKRRRCIIPADGFYEWKREGNRRVPLRIHRSDNGLFGFAGLWEEWQSPDGSPLRTCTIVTTEPNDLMASIHNRMPAILRPEEESLWLDTSLNDVPDILKLLKPYPDAELTAHPVSRRVNSPNVDDPGCIVPVEAESVQESGGPKANERQYTLRLPDVG